MPGLSFEDSGLRTSLINEDLLDPHNQLSILDRSYLCECEAALVLIFAAAVAIARLALFVGFEE